MHSVLDSWGKFPSGFFSGNFYEFGDFSECLNIERHGVRYETQYCLGQLILDLGKLNSSATFRSNEFNINHFNIPNVQNVPNVWQTNDDAIITPRMAITAP